ncbi:MAG: hypothetical protein LUE98_10330 [Tannerellaceae bacterium]|nr:hypothetical protein [Tannerellaceae bacterium]
MKHTGKCILAVILILSFGCTRPRYFTNYYTGEYTGLDTLINIEGYYCFESIDTSKTIYCIMLHNDGLFINVHTDQSDDSLKSYFEGAWPYPGFCGTYYLDKDTLKTQAILDNGFLYGVYVIFRNFLISTNGELSFIKEYMLENRDFKPKTYLNPPTFFH